MAQLEEFCRSKLQTLESQHVRRALRAPSTGLDFASNDYLGLRQHPEVIAAGQAALAAQGAGAGASRLLTGNHSCYAPLETQLAAMKQRDAALVFGSGYLANMGAITALVGEGDLILADKLIHACMIDAALLSGATLKRFKHNDMAHAELLLQEYRAQHRNALILTETIFSMDGDRAPLDSLAVLANTHVAWLLADDAHGLYDTATPQVDVLVGTFSKAVGAYGGYVAAAQSVIDFLVSSARPLIFSTGLPPAVCASAQAALSVITREPERAVRARAHAQRVAEALGLPPAQSTILPIIVGAADAALGLAERLRQRGIQAVAIRPPTVPANTARLRLTFSAAHSEVEVNELIAALKAEGLSA